MYKQITQLEKIAAGFVTCALWAESEDGTRPRITKQGKDKALAIVEKFINNISLDNLAKVLSCENNGYGVHLDCPYGALSAIGHDLYLTMQRHGSGFWDRAELPEGLRDYLTEESHKLSCEVWQYKGWFYIE